MRTMGQWGGYLMIREYNLKGKSDELKSIESIICFRAFDLPLPCSTHW